MRAPLTRLTRCRSHQRYLNNLQIDRRWTTSISAPIVGADPHQAPTPTKSKSHITQETTTANGAEPTKKRRGRPRKSPQSDADLIRSSEKHHDLASFLDYATTSSLSRTSTVYVGTHYEYTVSASLKRLGFTLSRVGGASDLGIDLLGTWSVPSSPSPLNVLVQCKAENPKPSFVREMEGALMGAPAGWRVEGAGTVAFLASKGDATKGVREALQRSRWAMGFLGISPDGRIRQMLWNAAAEECGLQGLGVSVSHDGKGQEVILTWNGKRVRQQKA